MRNNKTVWVRVYNVLRRRKTGITSKDLALKAGANWHSVRRTLGEMGTLVSRTQHATKGLLYSLSYTLKGASMR